MNFYDYAWGDYPTEESDDYLELRKYMNYNRGDGCNGFNNPWADEDNYMSQGTTPVGYFNGSTYYYPDGFTDDVDCEPVYEIQTENAVSPYGLYDCNGNAKDITSHYNTEGGWAQHYVTMGGSGWDGHSYCRSTAMLSFSGMEYGFNGANQPGASFRVVRTINITND